MQLPLPEHEVARHEVLGRYQIFGTPPEECFDNITHLATYVCGTPIALIGFIDQDSQCNSACVNFLRDCTLTAPNSLRLHGYLSLSLSAIDDGARAANRGPKDHCDPARGRTLQPGRPILGQDLRHQFSDRRGHWYSDGISVRHQLVAVRADHRRCNRAATRDGRGIFLLSGIGLPGTLLVW